MNVQTRKFQKISWKKKSKINGYQIQYSASSKFEKSTSKAKTISNTETTSATISKLKGCNKKYYVRVRTYKVSKDQKVYSSWSKIKEITTLKHNYNPATCTKAKKCSYCGKTKGKALEHNYKKETCVRCGETFVAKKFGYKVGDVVSVIDSEGKKITLTYFGKDQWKDQHNFTYISYKHQDGTMHWWSFSVA